MYIVTINFEKIKFKLNYDLNIESISIDLEDLLKAKGKYVTFYYTSDLINNAIDIYFNGKSLSGQYAPQIEKNGKKVTGILSGAKRLSGDTPSMIYVTNSSGDKYKFDWFIDDELIKLNNKSITVYYDYKYSNKITHIEL